MTVVKNTYRHPNIINTMMMLQNIEQMKGEMNRGFKTVDIQFIRIECQ